MAQSNKIFFVFGFFVISALHGMINESDALDTNIQDLVLNHANEYIAQNHNNYAIVGYDHSKKMVIFTECFNIRHKYDKYNYIYLKQTSNKANEYFEISSTSGRSYFQFLANFFIKTKQYENGKNNNLMIFILYKNPNNENKIILQNNLISDYVYKISVYDNEYWQYDRSSLVRKEQTKDGKWELSESWIKKVPIPAIIFDSVEKELHFSDCFIFGITTLIFLCYIIAKNDRSKIIEIDNTTTEQIKKL